MEEEEFLEGVKSKLAKKIWMNFKGCFRVIPLRWHLRDMGA